MDFFGGNLRENCNFRPVWWQVLENQFRALKAGGGGAPAVCTCEWRVCAEAEPAKTRKTSIKFNLR